MSESLGGSYALLGVEDKHALKKVDSYTYKSVMFLRRALSRPTGRICILESVLQRLALALGKRLHESEGLIFH